MDDTIYRQDAIDVLFSEPLYESGMKKRGADEVVPAIFEKIKALPSAQPEKVFFAEIKIEGEELQRCIDRAVERIKVEVGLERKKGRWINHRNDNGHNIADCSECGNAIQWFDDDEKPKFCCMCGADMRDER